MPRKMGEGGVGGEVVHKYIFQYSEDCKSEHFPQLWGDINFWKKREKIPHQFKELSKNLSLRLIIIKRFQRLFHVRFSCWAWPWYIISKVNSTNKRSLRLRNPTLFCGFRWPLNRNHQNAATVAVPLRMSQSWPTFK